MLDLVGNPEGRFARIEAHFVFLINLCQIKSVCIDDAKSDIMHDMETA